MNGLFANTKMPAYVGVEPSEIELQRISKLLEEGRFNELSRDLQRWATHRLMPSLARYGCYPPPKEIE